MANLRPGWFILLGCLVALISSPAAAQPIIVRHLTIDITLQPDGRYTRIYHIERSATNPTAAQAIAQFVVPFNPSLGRLEITEAYTLKSDGSRREVDVSAIRTQLASGVPNVPIFADVQQKVVVFPDLASGDTEVLTTRMDIDHPLFPGQFVGEIALAPATDWQDVSVSVTAPRSLPLYAEALDLAFERSEQEQGTRYAWHYRSPTPAARAQVAVSIWDYRPRAFVSSFADYAAFTAAYEALAAPKAAVTVDIQAKADEITAGIDSRRDQARALYEWVSRHIRYVALYLGRGGVEPHAAGSVLANGYGDCKDHVVLFEALLRAKGIESHAVLINADNAYTLSATPTMAQLNHVITWLPEFDLYADTTAGVAAFGMLPLREYGKRGVVVGVAGDPLRTLPVLRAEDFAISVRTTASLDATGQIVGNTLTTADGAAAMELRLLARQAQALGTDTALRTQLQSLGQPGRGSYRFASPDGLATSYQVSAAFTLEPRQEILDGDAFAPALGPIMLVRPGDLLLGPTRLPTITDDEPAPCFAGQQVEELSLTLPGDRKPLRLPADRQITRDAFTYTSHWAFQDHTVSVRRELVSHIDVALCQGALRHDAAAALREIHRDQQARIVLDVP